MGNRWKQKRMHQGQTERRHECCGDIVPVGTPNTIHLRGEEVIQSLSTHKVHIPFLSIATANPNHCCLPYHYRFEAFSLLLSPCGIKLHFERGWGGLLLPCITLREGAGNKQGQIHQTERAAWQDGGGGGGGPRGVDQSGSLNSFCARIAGEAYVVHRSG